MHPFSSLITNETWWYNGQIWIHLQFKEFVQMLILFIALAKQESGIDVNMLEKIVPGVTELKYRELICL